MKDGVLCCDDGGEGIGEGAVVGVEGLLLVPAGVGCSGGWVMEAAGDEERSDVEALGVAGRDLAGMVKVEVKR